MSLKMTEYVFSRRRLRFKQTFKRKILDGEIKCSPSKRHQFADPKKTIYSSYNQWTIPIGRTSPLRGSQCTSIAVSAILSSHICQPENWEKHHVDSILGLGHELHKRTIKRLKRRGKTPYGNFLMPDEIPQKYMKKILPDARVQFGNAMIGLVSQIEIDSQLAGHVLTLPAALIKLTDSDVNGIVLTTDDESVAVLKSLDKDHPIKVLDSHKRDREGRSDPGGKSVLLSFESVDHLVRYCRARDQFCDKQFQITPIRIKKRKTSSFNNYNRKVLLSHLKQKD